MSFKYKYTYTNEFAKLCVMELQIMILHSIILLLKTLYFPQV